MAYEVGKARMNKEQLTLSPGGERLPLFKKQAEQAEQEAQTAGRLRLSDIGKGITETFMKTFLDGPARLSRTALEAPETILRGGAEPTITKQITSQIPYTGRLPTFQEAARNRIRAGQSVPGAILKSSGEAALAGLETAVAAKGLTIAAKSGIQGTKRLFQATKGALTERAGRKTTEELVSLVKPKLTSKQERLAIQTGRGSQTKILGKTRLAPTERDYELAEAARGVVNPKKNIFENINSAKKEIAKISDNEVRGALKQNDAIFNENQLRSRLGHAKENSRVVFAADKTLESAYNSVIDEFVNFVKQGKNKVSNLFESRIRLDQFMRSKFGPDILDITRSGDKVRTNAILDVRRAANEYISELLPQGNKYKDLLKKESLLFEVIKNLANKAPKVGTTRFGRFFKAHPKATSALKIGGGAVVGGTAVGTGIKVFGQ